MGVSSEVRICCLTAGYYLGILCNNYVAVNVVTFNRHTVKKRIKRPYLFKKCPVNRKTCFDFVGHITDFVVLSSLVHVVSKMFSYQ